MASPFFEKSEASWAEWASACIHYFLIRTTVNQTARPNDAQRRNEQ